PKGIRVAVYRDGILAPTGIGGGIEKKSGDAEIEIELFSTRRTDEQAAHAVAEREPAELQDESFAIAGGEVANELTRGGDGAALESDGALQQRGNAHGGERPTQLFGEQKLVRTLERTHP